MQHKYPFTSLHITINPELLDVNVHPSKMELRFSNEQEIYNNVKESILLALTHRELIPEINLEKAKKEEPLKVEYNKKEPDTVVNYEKAVEKQPETVNEKEHVIVRKVPEVKKSLVSARMPEPFETKRAVVYEEVVKEIKQQEEPKQLELFKVNELLKKENKKILR